MPDNLITNPGFETLGGGGMDVWSGWTADWLDGSVADETVNVHSGGHAARLTAGSLPGNLAEMVYQQITVPPSTTYALSFWTRGDGSHDGAVEVEVLDSVTGLWQVLLAVTSTGVTEAVYTRRVYYLTTTPTTTKIQIRLVCSAVPGAVCYFDDVVLALPTTLSWHVWVDWNNDGIYEEDEGARFRGITIERGKNSFLDDPMVGRAEVLLVNHDRRYDGWYSGSPIYPNARAGRKVQITVEWDQIYYLFTGRIDNILSTAIRAAGAMGEPVRITRLIVHDGWQWVKDRKQVNVAMVTNTTTKDALTTLLNAIGWTESAHLWKLDAGALDTDTVLGGLNAANVDLGSDNGDTIPYWWSENEEATRNLFDLVASNWGRVHIDGSGKLVFRTRSGDVGIAADLSLTDDVVQEMLVQQPWEETKNSISIKANPRTLASVGDVWKERDVLTLQVGETRVVWTAWADASGNYAPATGLINPVATTDYTANAAADGSGADLTASLGVTMVAYSSNAQLTLVNNAGVVMYVTLLKVRGQLVQLLDSQAARAEDTASIELNGMRQFDRDLRWQQSTLTAQSMATWAVGFLKDPREVEEVKFETNPVALAHDLGAKINDATSVGAGGNFQIGKILHQCMDPSGQQLITFWRMYRMLPDDSWILGTSTLDVTTKLGI